MILLLSYSKESEERNFRLCPSNGMWIFQLLYQDLQHEISGFWKPHMQSLVWGHLVYPSLTNLNCWKTNVLWIWALCCITKLFAGIILCPWFIRCALSTGNIAPERECLCYSYAKSSTPIDPRTKELKIKFELTYVSLSSCSLGMIIFALTSTAGVSSFL